MAKKKSSKDSRARRRSYSPGTGRSSQAVVTKEFNPDYSYVIQDLKRIGILAASFVVILIVLSLIIN
jgi:hypothetical protein